MGLRSFCILWLLLATVALSSNAETDTVKSQLNLAQLNKDVQQYLEHHYANSTHAIDAIEINVNRLDNRLRLSACDKALAFTLRDTGNLGGNVSVHTQCQGSQPWALYVSAQVKIFQSVIVAARAIPRNSLIHSSDLDIQLRDTADLRHASVVDPNRLVGKVAKRTIRVGEAMNLANLAEPVVVQRGDALVIEAQSGAISVSSQAIALADGRIGEQISARNQQSERIIRVKIIGSGRAAAIL